MECQDEVLENFTKHTHIEANAGEEVSAFKPVQSFMSKRSLETVREISEETIREIIEENESLSARLTNEIQKNNKLRNCIRSITDESAADRADKNVGDVLKLLDEQQLRTCDECCQTWNGVMCAACKETADFRKELERIQLQKQCEGPVIEVKKHELDAIYENVIWLKDHFTKNGCVSGLSIDKAKKYIGCEQNAALQKGLNAKKAEVLSLRTQLRIKIDESEKFEAQKKHLKKIIYKLAKRHYQLIGTFDSCEPGAECPINENERKFIKKIIANYMCDRQTTDESEKTARRRESGEARTACSRRVPRNVSSSHSLHNRSDNSAKSNSSSATTKKYNGRAKRVSSESIASKRPRTAAASTNVLKNPQTRDSGRTFKPNENRRDERPARANGERRQPTCTKDSTVPDKRAVRDGRRAASSGSETEPKNKSETSVANRRQPLAERKNRTQCADLLMNRIDDALLKKDLAKLRSVLAFPLQKNPSC